MRYLLLFLLVLRLSDVPAQQPGSPVLRLHPQQPHYFLYKNKPTVIVGSGEHYGAVVNLDFDYQTYLQTLADDKLNTTRLFAGSYFEKQGAFGILKNTLAPAEGRLLLPWARSSTPGFALGGARFDMTKWDEAYFARLKAFMEEAERRGVIVEINLFSAHYGAGWAHSPFNRDNNVNRTDSIKPAQLHTLVNGNILAFQEQYVRKIVRELNGFDNLYFEIQNEPWADLKDTVLTRTEYFPKEDIREGHWRATLEIVAQAANDWQRRVAVWIRDEEKSLPKKHLISQDISNFHYPIAQPDPNVSIFNFHYAFPEAVAENYYLNKVIGFNETGFAGRADLTYRRQAWRFMMAGGGLFNHLDYSFSVGSENGKDTTYTAPGGGSPPLRKQFGFLLSFFQQLDLTRLRPDAALVKAAPGLLQVRALSNRLNEFVVYSEGVGMKPSEITLSLPKGAYRVEWINTATGQTEKAETVSHAGGDRRLPFPKPFTDTVLLIRKP